MHPQKMDFDKARFNMIEQQIRPWDVLDQRVLEVLTDSPREHFVPERYQQIAFADLQVPLDHQQFMMAPKVEARMLQGLDILDSDTVLEIGTGSAYVTACLARLANRGHVYSIDIFEDFIKMAKQKLQRADLSNISLECRDATQDWPEQSQFDVIAMTASLPQYDERFQELLNIDGRLFVVVGEAPVMQARVVSRDSLSSYSQIVLFETVLPPLINARRQEKFVL